MAASNMLWCSLEKRAVSWLSATLMVQQHREGPTLTLHLTCSTARPLLEPAAKAVSDACSEEAAKW